jgi:hypothetical protein
MTRLWLTKWEWACCGDAFAIGDEVDFGIETRTPHAAVSDVLGPELVATVDAMESHHEEEDAAVAAHGRHLNSSHCHVQLVHLVRDKRPF